MPSRARCSVNLIEVYWRPRRSGGSAGRVDGVAVSVAVPQRDPQRGEHQVGAPVGRGLPAHDALGEDVDDEGHVDEPGPGPAVGEVRDPDGCWVPAR